MKILKPGKVEQRKFVCPNCGCVFVARPADIVMHPFDDDEEWAECPECSFHQRWDNGEPYEESTPTQGCIDRLTSMLADLGYVNETTAWDIAVQLIEQGVTFREE